MRAAKLRGVQKLQLMQKPTEWPSSSRVQNYQVTVWVCLFFFGAGQNRMEKLLLLHVWGQQNYRSHVTGHNSGELVPYNLLLKSPFFLLKCLNSYLFIFPGKVFKLQQVII
jgi:tRNA-binding EMAP/Myf-like protein